MMEITRNLLFIVAHLFNSWYTMYGFVITANYQEMPLIKCICKVRLQCSLLLQAISIWKKVSAPSYNALSADENEDVSTIQAYANPEEEAGEKDD